MKRSHPFWETKSLQELTFEEWESLCDGCALCCLEKLEDTDTGEILLTRVSCMFLDIESCRCTVYENRFAKCPDCLLVSPASVRRIQWLPDTCAYRRISEGRPLDWWHPLVSGDPETVHRANISIRDRAISGRHVHPDDLADYIFD
ncbi:MAG: YcgN family cysteine cluster protein [Deltaproteobacteria bacterium]|nr:YcgN family cysteine cluster protein [Deltaproteobacteria bacterium]